MTMVWITSAKYIEDYRIALVFNDGVEKEVDLSSYLYRRPFEKLRDIEVFKNFTLDSWTLTWDDGNIDIAPESLYEMADCSIGIVAEDDSHEYGKLK